MSTTITTATAINEICLRDAVETFIRLELVNSSKETVKWYRGMLKTLAGQVEQLGELDEAELLEWQAKIYCQSRSAYSKAGSIRAAKRLLRWLFRMNILAADLGMVLKMPRLPRTGRRGISDGDLASILSASRSRPRDWALMLFLAETGCRRAGAAYLRWCDLNLDAEDVRLRRRAVVREKGDKERTVLMTDVVVGALKTWREIQPGGERVFGLAPAGVSEVVRRYAKRLGLTGQVSPHQFRHRWARKAIQGGMDIFSVKQLLGHENIQITERFYGQFTMDTLQEAYDNSWTKQRVE